MDLPLRLEVKRLTPAPLLPSRDAEIHLSPTSNYPAPHGTALLGETLRVSVTLRNVTGEPFTPSSPRTPSPHLASPRPTPPLPASSSSSSLHSGSTPPRPRSGTLSPGKGRVDSTAPGFDIRGAKMMLEVQSPGARTRLGEAVHGGREAGTDPATAESRAWSELLCLKPGESVELDVSHDIVELGAHILIASVAWETEDGRRTFQRFLKFNVTAPLAIKTRVHLPANANTALDAQRRSAVYLEVLMQNVSPVPMEFRSVVLQPTPGLEARSLGALEDAEAEAAEADAAPRAQLKPEQPLLPDDTTQRLFALTPLDTPDDVPVSSFPASFAPGTVVPLGRLDIAWVAGAEPGRFTTSTLNRRTPTAPPARPLSVGSARNSLSARTFEFDLTVAGERCGPAGSELPLTLRVGVRAPPGAAPPPLRIGVQLLSSAPAVAVAPLPAAVSVVPPSRTVTPRVASPAPSIASGVEREGLLHRSLDRRPFSPLRDAPSRPMTPVSAQLRHAAAVHIASPSPAPSPVPPSAPAPPQVSFPPPPTLDRPPPPLSKRLTTATLTPAAGSQAPSVPSGAAVRLGPSLVVPEPKEWAVARERPSTNYAAETPTAGADRWEVVYDVPVTWLALEEGLVELGGARVLMMDTEAVGREWESLGDVWVEA
ncbi:hypothetical protein CspeluHIS016_0800510 [Cutaneotrichosporon spelunceum]|uniref:DUF974-domain-containing protein n=1 Tax=Cutaneotrichosporon spelunceum TaxID=1672016 RepID=A0AAD3TYX5_9TREE|nr:hypothetical protein CspeluHIS016_0800510 [Cutaneotrichosporon spelunceum]